MMHINTINGKYKVAFDQGRFDKWCVYIIKANNNRYAPSDEEYFYFFKLIAGKYGADKVYNDFVAIYNVTTAEYNPDVITLIKDISSTYGSHAEKTELWFSVIYGGMIAEENKKGMVLKKRVKRLGMYQILIENYEPKFAARFSFGKKWNELNSLMKERGFGL